MRLISLTVRNYRIHKDLTIDFDPSRTLIGGPNETGKSTLAEAMHRALFFRHRSGGDVQRSMKSDVHNGHPEVKLVFEADGATWTLEKRFSGPSGTARLSSSHGLTLQGDAAEERLGQLTGHPGGAATTAKQLASHWAHLWVWQGTSGDNAADHAATLRDDLVQRLQDQGLAAVMQSEKDERAQAKIGGIHEDIFTRSGAVKTRSRLDLSTKALDEAQEALTRAANQKQSLQEAATEQESATQILNESQAVLPEQRELLNAANASIEKANKLRARQENERLVLNTATQTREQIAKADRQIRELHARAKAAEDALIPAEAKLRILADQEKSARSTAETAAAKYRSASDSVRLARQHHDLAAACVDRYEKETTHQSLTARDADVSKINQDLAADRKALAKLPAISPDQHESLRRLDSQLGQAESALAAIATGIELISTDQVVQLNGQPLEAGKPHIVTETTELTLGSTRLRVQPGGGNNLANARRKLDQLRQELADKLDQLSVSDFAKATEVLAERQAIEQRIANTESRLRDLGARELPKALTSAKDALDAATAEVERRHAAMSAGQAPELPTSAEAARTSLTQARNSLQEHESSEQSLLADADATRNAHQKKLTTLQSENDALETSRRNLADLQSSARALEQNHGDETARADALKIATEAEATAKAAFDTTTAAIAELDPESLQNTVTRLTRVIAREEEKQRDARTRIAVARNPHHLEVRLPGQHAGQSLAHDSMIIGD